MKSRRHGRKPTLALWMLVAVADVVVLIATAGLLTELALLAGLMVVAGLGGGLWLLQRRTTPATVSRPSAAIARRRA
jgi:hypothetical protein